MSNPGRLATPDIDVVDSTADDAACTHALASGTASRGIRETTAAIRHHVRMPAAARRQPKTLLPGLTVTRELDQTFRAKAASQGITMSEAMRRALEMYLAVEHPTGAFSPDELHEIEDLARQIARQQIDTVVSELRAELTAAVSSSTNGSTVHEEERPPASSTHLEEELLQAS